ncbi:Flp pilus assembly protein CpaB [uncultured Maritalea sp.]|mgnify:FL=1|uniref:Flp pilus assembly protein CpaB n=1 Tax=uncultured Maritalea sp. TaxID=757249 RepID=UPI002617F333|nr:Flp pilus assembly protein CpaB [uncultured Maritalea sp.]
MHRRILTPPIKMDEDFVAEPSLEAAPDVETQPSPKPVAVPNVEERHPDAPDGQERRKGDRRQGNDPNYRGPERRQGDRRNMDKLRSELNWQLAPEVENKILRGMGFKGQNRSSFKPARLILLMVALFAGGLAAFLSMQGKEEVAIATPIEIVREPIVEVLPRILVAKQTVEMGQRFTKDHVEWQDWPTKLMRDDYITFEDVPGAIDGLVGTITRFEFFAGEPIREQKLARDTGGYMSALISKGMRGVSVTVSGQAASGGFIVPNDRVDVVLTRDAPQGQVSETILRNIRVLALNARVGELGATGDQVDRDEIYAEMVEDQVIATLELDPAEAEIIVGATNIGTFALVLRSMVDFSQSRDLARSGVNQTIRLTSPFWNPPASASALH